MGRIGIYTINSLKLADRVSLYFLTVLLYYKGSIRANGFVSHKAECDKSYSTIELNDSSRLTHIDDRSAIAIDNLKVLGVAAVITRYVSSNDLVEANLQSGASCYDTKRAENVYVFLGIIGVNVRLFNLTLLKGGHRS